MLIDPAKLLAGLAVLLHLGLRGSSFSATK
jgi:hypothetical protein